MLQGVKSALSVNLVKSIWFNVFYFGIKGLKLPILIGWNCKCDSMGDRKSVIISNNAFKMGTVCIGIKKNPFNMGEGTTYWSIKKGGQIRFLGKCRIAKANKINISRQGVLTIGDGFTSNSNVIISCGSEITIGKDALLGWNVTIIDGDGHSVMDEAGNVINRHRSILIGDHVWIASDTTILKGSKIADNCIVGARSVVNHSFDIKNSIIAGQPAKIVKENITWNK